MKTQPCNNLKTHATNTPRIQWVNCESFPSKTATWKNGTDCCDWDGVSCDQMSGHVTGLDLACNNLTGELHPNSTIFQLTHLQQLNLAFNDFDESSMFSGIDKLVNLTHLNLSYPGWGAAGLGSGIPIPSTISHLSKLVSLDLTDMMRLDPSTWNKLIHNATNLRELHLRSVDMSSITMDSFSLLMNLSSFLVSLRLEQTGLHGNFPSDILYLPNLQELDLSYNENLRVELPKSNWTTPLRYLDLSDITFSGEIPNSLGHLKSLNHLRLYHCNFDGFIPSLLFHLTQLSYLDLQNNNLVGPIPNKISKLSKLYSLYLGGNKLNGTIPHWCYSLPSLSYLNLRDNQLTGSISDFTTYSLEYLDLSNNKLQGNFSNTIFELKNLTYLALSSNHLSGHVDIWKLKNLYFLDLSRNSFLTLNTDNNSADYSLHHLEYLLLSSCNISTLPKFLPQLQNLYVLDLSKNKIRGKIPKWFHDMLLLSQNIIQHIILSLNQLQGDLPIPPYGTQTFFVSNNNFTGHIPSAICNASSLTMLNLAHNNFIGMIPQCLGAFPYLSVLDLQMNNLHGNMPRNFSKGNVFETIKLNGNQLEGPLRKSLAHCTKLKVLDIADNNIVDAFPSWLETLPELQVLSLRSNKFHGVITCFNCTKHTFPKLRVFDASNNKFNGPLPASYIKNFHGMMNANDNQTGLQYMDTFGGDGILYKESIVVIMKGQSMELKRILITFTTIDLSNNMFEGEIPKVIGEMHSLKGLNLSHNALTGTIPRSLGNLRNLEWLDLSWNQLTGEIPMALTNLNFLSFLNLGQNQFEGVIPTGRQFDTFGNDSYEGNPMLCGVPLSKSCNKDEKLPPHSTFHHEESGFGWKSVAVGYACGMVFGVLLGYNLFLTGKPQWLARLAEAVLNGRVIKTNNRAPANRRGRN